MSYLWAAWQQKWPMKSDQEHEEDRKDILSSQAERQGTLVSWLKTTSLFVLEKSPLFVTRLGFYH